MCFTQLMEPTYLAFRCNDAVLNAEIYDRTMRFFAGAFITNMVVRVNQLQERVMLPVEFIFIQAHQHIHFV